MSSQDRRERKRRREAELREAQELRRARRIAEGRPVEVKQHWLALAFIVFLISLLATLIGLAARLEQLLLIASAMFVLSSIWCGVLVRVHSRRSGHGWWRSMWWGFRTAFDLLTSLPG